MSKTKDKKVVKTKAKKNENAKIPIDWKQVENLLMAGCSGVEIAASLGIHEDTLYNRCIKDLGYNSFSAFSAIFRQKGDSLLKAKQFESAVKDKNITMQIWLGKQRLGQIDKQYQEIDSNSTIYIDIPDMPDEYKD